MRNFPLRLILVSLVFAGLTAPACGGKSPTAPSSLPTLDEMLAEKALGSATAPNTIVEYSSLTCSHCADFHAAWLPQLRSKHIDTGNARFIYRDFALNDASVSGAMVARCAGNARYFEALDLLFRTRTTWSGDPARSLGSVMSGMMSQATVDACLALTDLRNGVLQLRAAGQSEFAISGTPTFIVNGVSVVGNQGLAALEAYFR
jgi:protein-disulfide isomerase